MSDTLDLLLRMDPPSRPTHRVKVKRLSAHCKEPVVFELRALSYSQVAEIKEREDQSDSAVQILLAGLAAPDLKDQRLQEKYKVPTPAELAKALLLPGEIEDLSRTVERLSGYRQNTLEELKKNSDPGTTRI